ncbi:helix-turn-helix domain-containing protein [Rhodococcus sp. NPDC058521]|uniref:helix-turn-helix domain-containing protein n=1 Tax=Rhodococcus sp. NPDC058521 TaxID=3346536 RepID=UPI00366881CB
MTSTETAEPVGVLLRRWREMRRLTQLGLSSKSGVSARHLSFVENGRSTPTRSMILRLSECMEVPLRQQNTLLLAAGFAPAFSRHALSDTPMSAVSDAIDRILSAHEPFPAVVVDRDWELVAGNDAIGVLIEGAAEHLLEPPVNVLRLSLHPEGMAPRIVNLGEWRAHLLERLWREVEITGDVSLTDLHRELSAYPGGGTGRIEHESSLVVPLTYRVDDTEISMFSTTTVFGTPRDVTLSEIAIEAFYPADEATAAFFRRRAGRR